MIKIKCTNALAEIVEKERITSGASKAFKIQFDFDGAWNGLGKTAVFKTADYDIDDFRPKIYEVAVDADDSCLIPWEVLAEDDVFLTVGVRGTNAAGDVVIPTIYAVLGRIYEGAEHGANTQPPTPDVVDQLIGVVGAVDAKYGVITSNIIDDVDALKNDIYVSAEQDWSELGNDNYPLGWYTGYYGFTDAIRHSSAYYICSRISLKLDGYSYFVLTPPEGYAITCLEYNAQSASQEALVNRYGSSDYTDPAYVNKQLVIPVTDGHYYRFTVGRINSKDSDVKCQDADFVGSIILEKYQIKNNATENIDGEYGCIAMFDNIGICGYSWDSGYFYVGDKSYTRREHSWGAILARKNGTTGHIYGVPSGTTIAPNSPYIAPSTVCWQTNTSGLPKLLTDEPCDLYWLRMIGNDITKLGEAYIGNIEDITNHEADGNYPDTFYGNYGRIMSQVKVHAPNAKFIFSGNYSQDLADVNKRYWFALNEIADYYGVPTINWLSDKWYRETLHDTTSHMVHSHPVAVDYAAMAMCAERLFARCVKDNFEYFKDYTPKV